MGAYCEEAEFQMTVYVLQQIYKAHPGVTCMKQMTRTLMRWPGIERDIEQEVQACGTCQVNQSSPPETPMLLRQWPAQPWSRVHVDFMGPFQKAKCSWY